ncbi:aldo/keto reductase [Actinomyces sp.]|uniref:aldo/keto reductase n=1 Tax=Actinomyces sp. TaxID=29317 RepID=UPI0026DB9A63|nr:aldo/keto reductase [Actinomyces sp.]MDO4900365.1 aldo/keto reductase [Actinomyces sp.]
MTENTATALSLPAIGLGTYKLRGAAGAAAVTDAIATGYRLVDTAFSYENEGSVARGVAHAIEQGAARREEIVITSKVPGRHYGHDEAIAAVEESMARMSPIGVIDLYLIHWPNPAQDRYVETWAGLVQARERGLVRHIGVSNFLPEYIERLEREVGVLPEVNQIESHPYFPNSEQVSYNTERGILTEAWSPLGRGQDVLTDPVVLEVAEAHAITAAQAVLAWHVDRGVHPIPKSATPARQRENLAAASVRLDAAAVEAISALGRPDGRLFDGDPRTHEEM